MAINEASTTANRQIARAAGTVMAAFFLSNLIGLVRQILVTNAFGTTGVIDAFNAASTYPDLIFSLVAGGALASAFVPVLTGFLNKDDRKSAWFLSSAVGNLVFLILTLVSLVSILLAPQIVHYFLAPKYGPAQLALTVSLMRILLISPAIFGVSGLIMGILNSHQVFIWPALAPTMYWLGMIFGVLFLAPSMGIYGLAWGAVLGAVLHLLIQVPALFRLPARRYFPTLGWRFPAVREVARLMGPRLLGVAIVQLNFVINTVLATGQPVGSLTAIKVAWAVMSMPQVVIAQSIAIAALPTFSAQVARGELGQMRGSLAASLRGVLLLSIPATFGLILLRQPVIVLFFQHGVFTAHSTDLTAWALLWYTVGLVGHSVVEIVARAFYALHDTKTPVFIGVAAMSLNLVFSVAFSALFTWLGWMPHGGLALANSLATFLEMAGLLVFMRRRLDGLEGRRILAGLAQASAATLVMSLGLWFWLQATSSLPVWVTVIGGVGLGAVLYGLVVLALRVSEAKTLLGVILQKARSLTGQG
jgi:putative peptidoglycan lipid II flippase